MKTGVVDDSGFMRLVLKKIISENTDLGLFGMLQMG